MIDLIEQEVCLLKALELLKKHFRRDDILMAYADYTRFIRLGFKSGDKSVWCGFLDNTNTLDRDITVEQLINEIFQDASKQIDGWLEAGWDGRSFSEIRQG